MATTPNRGYPYPIATDAPAVHTALLNLATGIDTDMQVQVSAIATNSALITAANANVVSDELAGLMGTY
jgi:hypothetical protein